MFTHFMYAPLSLKRTEFALRISQCDRLNGTRSFIIIKIDVGHLMENCFFMVKLQIEKQIECKGKGRRTYTKLTYHGHFFFILDAPQQQSISTAFLSFCSSYSDFDWGHIIVVIFIAWYVISAKFNFRRKIDVVDHS